MTPPAVVSRPHEAGSGTPARRTDSLSWLLASATYLVPNLTIAEAFAPYPVAAGQQGAGERVQSSVPLESITLVFLDTDRATALNAEELS
jgi:hypothetical protein